MVCGSPIDSNKLLIELIDEIKPEISTLMGNDRD